MSQASINWGVYNLQIGIYTVTQVWGKIEEH